MRNRVPVFIFLLITIAFSSCSVNRFIPPGKHLVRNYEVKYEGKKNKAIDNSEVKAYLRPKPNKNFLGLYYSLYIYYRAQKNPSKLSKWLNKKMGEEPVYLSDVDVDKLGRKMQRYLENSGFYDTQIKHEVVESKKKATIVYTINTGRPYIIDSTWFTIPDSLIKHFVFLDVSKSLVKKGDIFNAYTLDDERGRITAGLRNVGYYYFNQNFVKYVVDTNFNNHRLTVETQVVNRKVPDPMVLGNFIELPHQRYFIKKVEVYPDYNPVKYDTYVPFEHPIRFFGDSTYLYKYMLHMPKPRFKLNAFDYAINVKPGRPYSAESVKNTYGRLFAFPIIQTATISFDTSGVESDSTGRRYMNARVQMATGKLNFYSIEGELTNSSGDPGVRGSVVVANRNLFRGAEVFRVKVNGGFEAQSVSASDSTGAANSGGFFNTFEAGFDASIIFPRFISPIPFRRFEQKYHPTTNLTFGFNYLQRPNYSRNSTNLLLGYSWRNSRKLKFIISPATINFVNVNPTPEFQEILDEETNRRLKEQYSDHLIAGGSISMIYDNQKIKGSRSFDYVRLDFETSGNLIYGAQSLFGVKKGEVGYYYLFGVRYAQYARINLDYRHYFHLYNPENVVAVRGLTGAGIPYLNSNEIPYEKGFYAGGANDMRGWRFRELGPGGYAGEENYERVGDIQLEANVEYRFTIYSFLKGAFFTDIGNIWSYNADNYPNGQFKWNEFYKQLAVDGGFGLRFDFSYFIFRLDAGIPLRDPAYPEGERWRVSYLQFRQFVINFGIGYPF